MSVKNKDLQKKNVGFIFLHPPQIQIRQLTHSVIAKGREVNLTRHFFSSHVGAKMVSKSD